MRLTCIKRRQNTTTDTYGTLDSLVERVRTTAPGVLTHTYVYVVRYTSVAGLSVRSNPLGATSIVPALSLDAKYHNNLLDNCHSAGISLPRLSIMWIPAMFHLFGQSIKRVNNLSVILADGKKKGKEEKKMPTRKSLHQESESKLKLSYYLLLVS